MFRVVKTFKSHKSGPSGAAAVTQAVVTWPPGLQHKFNTCGELHPHTAMCAGTLAQHTVLKKTKKKPLGLFLMTLCLLRKKKNKTLQGLCVCAEGEKKKARGTSLLFPVSRTVPPLILYLQSSSPQSDRRGHVIGGLLR